VPRRRIPHAAVTCLASISASSTRGEQWSPAIRDRGSSFVKNSFPGIWAKSVLASYPAWCCLEKTGEDGDENTEISSVYPVGSRPTSPLIRSADPQFVWIVHHTLSSTLELDLIETQGRQTWVFSQSSRIGQRPRPSTIGESGHVLVLLLSLVA
jgi:hypothetical protein